MDPAAIDYLNLHGTGTALNDAMESKAAYALFGGGTPAGSTKSLTGHTLGAAGAIELGICWLALSPLNPGGLLPVHAWDGQPDPALPALDLVGAGRKAARLDHCMSNSFAFGGCNVSLIVGRG
jgi:3-oxoacyl-[acyl-carrier-protein] synthase-1